MLPEKPRDIALIPSVPKRMQRWWASWIRSIMQMVEDVIHQGPVDKNMVSVNQRLIPWQRIGFDTA